jgi:hypothetical protein
MMVASVLAVMTAISLQHETSAIIIDGSKQFKDLTRQLEEDVLDAAATGDSAQISRLLDQ